MGDNPQHACRTNLFPAVPTMYTRGQQLLVLRYAQTRLHHRNGGHKIQDTRKNQGKGRTMEDFTFQRIKFCNVFYRETSYNFFGGRVALF